MDVFKNTLNKILPYSALIPIVFAFVPFVIALLMVLSFSAGDFTNAAYIINHTGIIDIWLQGLVASLTLIVEFFLPYTIYFLIWNIKKDPIIYPIIILLLLFMAAAVTPLTLFVYALIIFAMSKIMDYVLGKRGEREVAAFKEKAKNLTSNELDEVSERLKRELKNIHRRLSLVAVLGLLLLIFYVVNIFPSLIPKSDLTLIDGKSINGKLLSEKDGEILIFDQDSKKLEIVKSDDVKTYEICIKSAVPLWSQSPFGLLTNTQIIKVC